jgi:hypothetical protein
MKKTTKTHRKTYMLMLALTLGLMPLSAARAESHVPLGAHEMMSAARVDKLLQESKELQVFFKAKEQVFKRKWEAARSQLVHYLQTYPEGQLADEALYWLAHTLNKISQTADSLTRITTFKQDALQRLETLARSYPDSLWKDDGESLSARIVGELALLGKKEYEVRLKSLSLADNKSVSDIKLVALGTLADLEPAAAFEAVQYILTNEKDPKIRKKALFLLGSAFDKPEAVALLKEIAEKDDEPEIRAEAESLIKRIALRNIPVQLNYYAFAARLKDKSQYGLFKEKQVNSFALPRNPKGDMAAIKKSCEALFKGNLTDFKSAASSRGISGTWDVFYSRQIKISHKLNNILVSLIHSSIDMTESQISGKFSFTDLKEDREYIADFSVKDAEDLLLAARRGDGMALVVVQFESTAQKGVEAPDVEPGKEGEALLNAVFGTDEDPLYSTEYSSVLGCRVLSTSQSTGMTMSGKGGKYDFSFAKAEIPSKEGTWELTGYLLGLKEEKRLLGRMAVLFNPKGRVAALGNQISLPIDNPKDFTVEGSRMDEPDVRKLIALISGAGSYPLALSLEGGGRVFSSRSSFSMEELQRDIVDFGEAEAHIQGSGGTWVLNGTLILDRKNHRITARKAHLTKPDGTTAAEAEELMVPLTGPQGFKVVKK